MVRKSKIKKLIVITLILHVLILVGAGHGIAFLGLLEIVIFISEDYIYAFSDKHQQIQAIAAMISLSGQILLLFVLIWNRIVKYILPVAMFALYSGLILLSLEFNYNTSAQLSFYTGIPFLILSFILIKVIYFNNKIVR